jgi:hypothetical protein
LRRNDGGARHRVSSSNVFAGAGGRQREAAPGSCLSRSTMPTALDNGQCSPRKLLRKVLTWTTTKSRAQRSLGVGPPATRWGPESPQQPPPPYQRRREIAGGHQPFGLFALAERRGCAIPFAGAEESATLSCMRASRLAGSPGCNRSHARTDVLVGGRGSASPHRAVGQGRESRSLHAARLGSPFSGSVPHSAAARP